MSLDRQDLHRITEAIRTALLDYDGMNDSSVESWPDADRLVGGEHVLFHGTFDIEHLAVKIACALDPGAEIPADYGWAFWLRQGQQAATLAHRRGVLVEKKLECPHHGVPDGTVALVNKDDGTVYVLSDGTRFIPWVDMDSGARLMCNVGGRFRLEWELDPGERCDCLPVAG